MPIDPVPDPRSDEATRRRVRPASGDPATNGNGSYPYADHWAAGRPDDPFADPFYDTLKLGSVVPPPERPARGERPRRPNGRVPVNGEGPGVLTDAPSGNGAPGRSDGPAADFFDDDEADLDIDIDEVTSSTTRNILEWAVVLVGAVLVALLLRATLFQAFWIPSASMETTLLISDRVLVNKVSYQLHDINRGDVVVFANPDFQPGDPKDLIKRVIGLPGDTVEAHENSIYINGKRLEEPYLDEGERTLDFDPIVVPEEHVFVMGDNRDESLDSRVFGPISTELVTGRAFVLFWPPNRISAL